MRRFDLDLSRLLFWPPKTGKTGFALAHFTNPLFVRPIDTLKEFRPLQHDGIVFDDMSFRQWFMNSIKHLLDTNPPRYHYYSAGCPTDLYR